jgi:RHS repeat-associated protein
VALPGGAAVRFVIAGDAREQWSYPNLQGSVVLEADGDGLRSGSVIRYDPWGQPIDPVTGRIGTAAADDAVIDNAEGDADYAFVGGHRKLYEHQGSVAVVQMGARVYVPALGRFLSVDPVEGGVTNSYDYPADPVNKLDLSGMLTADSYATILERAKKTGSARPKWDGIRAKPPTMTQGSSSSWLAGPKNCDRGQCAQTDYTIDVCGGVCASPSLSVREDGKYMYSLGLGIGVEADLSFNVGGSSGKGPGPSFGFSCSAAAIAGGHVEGGVSLGWKGDLVWGSPTVGSYYGAGYTVGAGAGCGARVGCQRWMDWLISLRLERLIVDVLLIGLATMVAFTYAFRKRNRVVSALVGDRQTSGNGFGIRQLLGIWATIVCLAGMVFGLSGVIVGIGILLRMN